MFMLARIFWLVLLLGTIIAYPQAQAMPTLRVAVTHPIIADVARVVGGSSVSVQIVADPADPAYVLTSDDLQTADEADLLLVNGMGLEPFLPDLISYIDTPYYVVNEGINVIGELLPEVVPADVSVYMRLENTSAQPLSLVTAEGDWFSGAMIHSTTIVNDMARMNDMEEGLALPPGEVIALEPAGTHLMLLGVKRDLTAGDELPLALRFSDGSEMTVTLKVGESAPDTAAAGARVVAAGVWAFPLKVALPAPAADGPYLGLLADDVLCDDGTLTDGPTAACNPYTWLDPTNVMVWASSIADYFSEHDPANAAVYAQNAADFAAQLESLDARIQDALRGSHAAMMAISLPAEQWAYFAARYGLALDPAGMPYTLPDPLALPQEGGYLALMESILQALR